MEDQATQKPNLVFGKKLEAADEKPKDVERTDGAQDQGDSTNDSAAGDEVVQESVEATHNTYSSHPIGRFAIGKYEFTNGQLKLPKGKESDRFERLIDSLPPHIKRQVVKLDVGRADRFVQGLQSKVVTGIDSTAGSIGPSATQQA
jgi:hypothetical protein